jgi:hypothetical protein
MKWLVCPIHYKDTAKYFKKEMLYKRDPIAFLGSRRSGKSTFIAVFIHEINNTMATYFDVASAPVNEATETRYEEDFHKLLYEDKKTLNATKDLKDNNKFHDPLVFEIATTGNDGKKRYQILSFNDTAGETMNDPIRRNKYVTNTSAIILLLDPKQEDIIIEKLNMIDEEEKTQKQKGSMQEVLNKDDIKNDVDENTENDINNDGKKKKNISLDKILDGLSKSLRAAFNDFENVIKEIPLIVVISKVDILKDKGLWLTDLDEAGLQTIKEYEKQHGKIKFSDYVRNEYQYTNDNNINKIIKNDKINKHIDYSTYENINDLIALYEENSARIEEKIVEFCGAGIRNKLETFPTRMFFAVSALGKSPRDQEHEELSGDYIPNGPTPFGIIDPLVWLLHKKGILTKKN